MKRIIWIIAAFFFIIQGCNKVDEVPVPVPAYSFMSQTNPLLPETKTLIEGVYSVSTDESIFGEQVVVKFTRKTMLIACRTGRYFVLESGSLDSVIIFQGYWRYANNDDTGPVNFYISKEDGGIDLMAGRMPEKIVLRGAYGVGQGVPATKIVLEFVRPFSEKVKNSTFHILAHRGGGRTSDRLPVSENSIAMIDYTEKFGSTGIEVDVRLSKDSIPFLYHDDDINVRLTQKGPLQGDITKFTFQQLRDYVRLIHGEQIPSLEEALDFTIDSTDLNFVYLDMKGGSANIDRTVAIQKRALQRAQQAGKQITIVLGIPAQDILDYFVSLPDHATIPSLCELEVEDVRLANSLVWAPRWTLGTQNDLVQEMHNEGRLVVTWTVDQASYIQEFINDGNFDGILTNYPSMVAYYHYIQ